MRINLCVISATSLLCLPIWAQDRYDRTESEQWEASGREWQAEAVEEHEGAAFPTASRAASPTATSGEETSVGSGGSAAPMLQEPRSRGQEMNSSSLEHPAPVNCLELGSFAANTGIEFTATLFNVSGTLLTLGVLGAKWNPHPAGAASCISPETEELLGEFIGGVSNKALKHLDNNRKDMEKVKKEVNPPRQRP